MASIIFEKSERLKKAMLKGEENYEKLIELTKKQLPKNLTFNDFCNKFLDTYVEDDFYAIVAIMKEDEPMLAPYATETTATLTILKDIYNDYKK